jgi:chemotaxis protein histidine kinase CheA
MAKTTAPAPDAETEEINFGDSPATSSATGEVQQGSIDVDALIGGLGDDADWNPNALLGAHDQDLSPHEADRDFVDAPDAVDVSGESPFARYLGRDVTPVADPETGAPVAIPEATPNPDLTDPDVVEIAKGLGLSPEELLGETPLATPAPEEATPAAPTTPEVAALTAQLEAMQAQLEALTQQQAQAQTLEAQAQALAAQEAQAAADRASYEATQRAAYEEQYEHLDDADREALVEARVEADLLRWDGQASQQLAEARAQAQAQQEALAQREAGYTATTKALMEANPTLAGELMPGYPMADFLADTHRAACDAYGMDAIGEFEAYAKAFEGGLKSVQTKAFQAGIAYAQARAGRSNAAPPVLSNKGGGSAPTPPKSGPAKLDMNTINFFAPEGRAARR